MNSSTTLHHQLTKNPVMMRKPSTRLTVSFVYLMFVDTKDKMNLQGLHRRLKETNSLTLTPWKKLNSLSNKMLAPGIIFSPVKKPFHKPYHTLTWHWSLCCFIFFAGHKKLLMDTLSIPYVDFEDDLSAYTATGLIYKVVPSSLASYQIARFFFQFKIVDTSIWCNPAKLYW